MLTKSKIIKGIRCKKSLWLHLNKPSEAIYEENNQGIFATGIDIGILARNYFTGGELALVDDYPNYSSAQRTMQLIQQGFDTIYEATFIYDDVLVAVDILKKINGKWSIYECKSSTSAKAEHVLDAAIQYRVVNNSGIEVEDVFVLHIDNCYIRRGAIEAAMLFKATSIIENVLYQENQIKVHIEKLKELQSSGEPIIEVGKHCHHPYLCEFLEYCSKLIPATVSSTNGILEHGEEIKKDAIKKRLEDFGYPLFYLDFETLMPGIPMFDESRPFQQIPFQYSLHYKESRNSQLEHHEFLAYPNGDPREDLIKKMIYDLKRPGKILTYNVGFERTRIKELARDFPKYKTELNQIIGRLDDLMPIFRSKEYHETSMGKGYSIKLVLPILAPELSYKQLEISNGGDASSEFFKLYESTDKKHIENTRKALLKYCHLDTLAMVRILEELERRCA